MSFTVKSVILLSQQPMAISVPICGRQVCHKGHTSMVSVSDCFSIHTIIRGKGVFRCRGEEHHLSAGDLFLLPPYEKVFYKADMCDPWEYFFFNLTGEDVGKWMEMAGFQGGRLVFRDIHDSAAHHFARAFEAALTNASDVLTVVGELLTATALLGGNKEIPLSEAYSETAKRYIETNYNCPMKISDIADYIGIDRTHLYREFKRDTGVSPQEWLLEFRLGQARKLMTRSDLTLTEIALSTGFCDLTHFSHAYSKKYGTAPGKDRLLREAREQSGGGG